MQVAPMPEVPRREWREDRYGFLRWVPLPRLGWREWWDRIYVEDGIKDRLRSYAVFALVHRAEFSRVGLPLSGIALLHGPSGTGKSSLARGLAQVVAESLAADGVAEEIIYGEIDPHTIPSQMLGESQRNTIDLLEKSLPELASKGHPLVVALDEVDSLATRRSLTTGGRDPVDVMRATEAVLRGVDYLAAAAPNVVVVATSNFVEAVDEALLDRVDVAMRIGLPDAGTARRILEDSLSEVSNTEFTDTDLQDMADRLAGRSGREIRKVVVEALATREVGISEPLKPIELDQVIDRTSER